MRRRDHPSFPSEITCCFLSVLKTLLMPSEPIRALSGVNVPGLPMAGFQLTLYGRIWVTPEGNPAAVVFDCDDMSTEWMQAVSREMNLSETVFFVRPTKA